MTDKIALVLTMLFALFLQLCFDESTQQSVGRFLDLIIIIYICMWLIPAVILAVAAAVHAYKKSNNPKKRENMRFMLITGGILAAVFVLILLFL